jgi:hypothetical protein
MSDDFRMTSTHPSLSGWSESPLGSVVGIFSRCVVNVVLLIAQESSDMAAAKSSRIAMSMAYGPESRC